MRTCLIPGLLILIRISIPICHFGLADGGLNSTLIPPRGKGHIAEGRSTVIYYIEAKVRKVKPTKKAVEAKLKAVRLKIM